MGRSSTHLHRARRATGAFFPRLYHTALARLQDWLTPLWRRLTDGCRLDRRTVQSVADAGFALARVKRELGGYVVRILAWRTQG